MGGDSGKHASSVLGGVYSGSGSLFDVGGGECRGELLQAGRDSGKHASSVLGGGQWLIEPLRRRRRRGSSRGRGNEFLVKTEIAVHRVGG